MSTALHTHRRRDVRLASGAVLPELCTAYATQGRLDGDGANAVLVLHGYTTGPDMLQPGASVAEGSWSALVGPGRAIDTERWFIVCPNMLGSSYGSTGPGSVDPRTGRPYGIDFPRTTMADVVAAQKALLDDLGVRRIAAVVGPSLGGYQALQWGVSHPGMVDRIVSAVSAPFNPPGVVDSVGLLARLAAQPAWNGGHPEPHALDDWLTALRVDTLRRYGIDDELATRLPHAADRAAEVQRLARQWAQGFHPGALVTLAQVAESFDVRPQLAALRAPLLLVISRSDQLFSPALVRSVAPLLDAAGVRWSYSELDSDKGHLASGADAGLWAPLLGRFMATAPGDWVSWGLPA